MCCRPPFREPQQGPAPDRRSSARYEVDVPHGSSTLGQSPWGGLWRAPTLSRPLICGLATFGIVLLLVLGWAAVSALIAGAPSQVAAAVAHEMRLAAGSAVCEGAALEEAASRAVSLVDAARMLRVTGSVAAAAVMDTAARGDISEELAHQIAKAGLVLRGDGTLRLDEAVALVKPWACWFEEDVTGPAMRAAGSAAVIALQTAWAAAERCFFIALELAAVRPDVTLGVLALVAVALWRWNVRQRDRVVAAMFDCALLELEAIPGRTIPLAQLRPHVLDRLYSGAFSVMALRASRYWPRVEARLKLDPRLFVDAATETSAGLVQPCATWVSPLRRSSSGGGRLHPGNGWHQQRAYQEPSQGPAYRGAPAVRS